MPIQTEEFDPTRYLKTDEAIAAYLQDAVESGDPRVVAACLGDVARAKGMTDLARETGLSRESLYRSLSGQGNPELATLMKVIEAMGLQLRFEPKHSDAA